MSGEARGGRPTSDHELHDRADKDVEGPFLHKLPSKLEGMKGIPKLSYTSPREGLAEKFQMSEELLVALESRTTVRACWGNNRGRRYRSLIESSQKAARVEVDENWQIVKLFDQAGALIGFYPATVGSQEKPSPSGTLQGDGNRTQSNLSLQSGLSLQGRPFPQAVHGQARTQQPGRQRLDQSFGRRLRDPRDARSWKSFQGGIPRMRAADELGC